MDIVSGITGEQKIMFAILSGVIACGSASIFAIQVAVKKAQANLATWAMILLLDVVGLALVLLEDNKKPYMQVGWMIAGVLIFIAALVRRGEWQWGKVETWATSICLLSGIIWVVARATGFDSRWAIAGYIVACYVSVVPQGFEFLKKRGTGRSSAWLWLLGIPITVLGAIGSEKYTPEYLAIPLGLLVLNAAMSGVCLLPAPKGKAPGAV